MNDVTFETPDDIIEYYKTEKIYWESEVISENTCKSKKSG